MDGIIMAKSVGDLTEDRENLSVDLADKAITIRKLLEDNAFLNKQLQDAERLKQSLKSSKGISRSF